MTLEMNRRELDERTRDDKTVSATTSQEDTEYVMRIVRVTAMGLEFEEVWTCSHMAARSASAFGTEKWLLRNVEHASGEESDEHAAYRSDLEYSSPFARGLHASWDMWSRPGPRIRPEGDPPVEADDDPEIMERNMRHSRRVSQANYAQERVLRRQRLAAQQSQQVAEQVRISGDLRPHDENGPIPPLPEPPMPWTRPRTGTSSRSDVYSIPGDESLFSDRLAMWLTNLRGRLGYSGVFQVQFQIIQMARQGEPASHSFRYWVENRDIWSDWTFVPIGYQLEVRGLIDGSVEGRNESDYPDWEEDQQETEEDDGIDW